MYFNSTKQFYEIQIVFFLFVCFLETGGKCHDFVYAEERLTDILQAQMAKQNSDYTR